MPGIGSALFGSGPSVQNSAPPPSTPTPTISGVQQNVQNTLGPLLTSLFSQGGGFTPFVQGGASAGLGNNLLQALQGYVAPNAYGTSPISDTASALLGILSGYNQLPNNYAQFFQSSVAQPLEQTFSQQTLPALQAAFARSAGGTYSGQNNPSTVGPGNTQPTTGYAGGINFADQNLEQQLANAATNLSYTTQQAGIQNALKASALMPSITAAGPSNLESILTALMGPAQLYNQLLGIGSNFSATPTVQNIQGNTAVVPGQTGIIPGLLGGLAGNTGFGTALGSFIFGG
jgi:hypothetical protein